MFWTVFLEICFFSSMFKTHDPFSDQKRESFFSTIDSVKSLSEYIIQCSTTLGKNPDNEAIKLEFETLLQVSNFSGEKVKLNAFFC